MPLTNVLFCRVYRTLPRHLDNRLRCKDCRPNASLLNLLMYLIGWLLFEGLGILLVVVICIGWRCTPSGHEPCHLLFNFEQLFDVSRSHRGRQTDRRRERALDQSQWFGGTLATAVLSFFSSFVRKFSKLATMFPKEICVIMSIVVIHDWLLAIVKWTHLHVCYVSSPVRLSSVCHL